MVNTWITLAALAMGFALLLLGYVMIILVLLKGPGSRDVTFLHLKYMTCMSFALVVGGVILFIVSLYLVATLKM